MNERKYGRISTRRARESRFPVGLCLVLVFAIICGLIVAVAQVKVEEAKTERIRLEQIQKSTGGKKSELQRFRPLQVSIVTCGTEYHRGAQVRATKDEARIEPESTTLFDLLRNVRTD